MIEGSAAAAVYGTDETIEAIRRRHPNTPVIPHGHGVSAAYCGPDALDGACIDDTIASLALDVCAYDQRGCLSPQIIFVEKTDARPLSELSARLGREGFEPLSKKLPRGPLPLEIGAAQAQWRGVAEVEGSVVAGDDYAIAVRPPEPIRWSPGYRNVTMAEVQDPAEAVALLTPLGASLKCVGVNEGSSAALRRALEAAPGLSAYTCPLGTMQTPSLNSPADGKPVWDGLLH